MVRPAPALRIDLDRARAHWHRSQGLAEPLRGSLEEIVAATGWVRTLGGADVYLALRARVPGLHRADLDAAVEASRLQVIPAVRGCIYLVPRADVPLALRTADEQARGRMDRELEKVGVSQEELAGIAEASLAALKKGPLTTDALRRALPEGTVRSLGEKGKKIGMSSPLPSALRVLEFAGKIERTLEGGRLDTERYAWRVAKKSPFAGAKLPSDAVDRNAAVARAFHRQAGPASVADFASWSGLSQRDARAAADRAGLVPIAVDGYTEDAFVLEEHVAALRASPPPATSVSLLSFEDNFTVLHGGPGLLMDPKHHARSTPVWGQSRPSTLGDAKHIAMRPLLDGDRLAGLWELDPDAGKVVFGSFDKLPAAKKKAIAALAEETAAFLLDELGHAKSFTLDTMDEVKKRAAAVKALG